MKRVFSLVLSLMMLLSLIFPVGVFAEEFEYFEDVPGEEYYEDFLEEEIIEDEWFYEEPAYDDFIASLDMADND